jgi:hypothetical protein
MIGDPMRVFATVLAVDLSAAAAGSIAKNDVEMARI